tara:strand:- start:1994 stop:2230 length:237 start_codon:yes stop_codon:yes gene_type:complete
MWPEKALDNLSGLGSNSFTLIGVMCKEVHWVGVHKPDLRLVLLVRQVAVAAFISLDKHVLAVCVVRVGGGLMYDYSQP